MTSPDAVDRPPLTAADAWILAAVMMQADGRAPLADVIAAMDFLQHTLPTYDELSYGLSRLGAAGLVDVEHHGEDMVLAASETSRQIDEEAAGGRRDAHAFQRAIAAALGATDDEPADLSHGRLPDFDAAAMERATAAYRAAVRSGRRRRRRGGA